MHGGQPNSQILYACNCLNVKLRCKRSDGNPNLPSSPDYTPVYTERDEDIKIVYPHLTLRTRKRAPFVSDPAKTARYTSLTCLCCQTLVYRIHQVVSVNDEHNLKEGPIITKGWTETEVLRSTSGWVEVFQHVLTEEGIRKQESTPEFSPTFGIVIALSSSSGPSETISGRAIVPEDVPKYKLPPIPPIFPEPKSTTSLFAALASIAGHKSSELRSSAEEHIDDIAQKKIHEIRIAENQLKKDVQFLLNKYNEGIKKAEQEQTSLSSVQTPPQTQRTLESSRTSTPGKPVSVVHDFVPTTPAQPRSPPPRPSAPPVSALSASLVTSSFHHPRAQHHSPPRSPISLQSASSATLIMHPPSADAGNVHRWGRNTNEQMDIATSYRFFLNLEDEMERRQRDVPGASTSAVRPQPNPDALSTAKTTERKEEDARPAEVIATVSQATDSKPSPSPKSKGKRKVTFDVKVDQPGSAAGSYDPVNAEDMMFDFEDENEGRGTGAGAPLPLVEQPAPRSHHPHRKVSKELPNMLSNLRPSSLPTPSYLANHVAKPSAGTSGAQEGHVSPHSSPESVHADLPELKSLPIPGRVQNGTNAAEASRSPREQEILTKLAASMPSHRAAWRNNSREFTSFFSEKSDDWLEDGAEGTAPETTDGGREEVQPNVGVPGSVPIAIHRPDVKPQPVPLSLASYRADAFLSTQHAINGRRASRIEPVPEAHEQPGDPDSTPTST
ncbi:hypothetical protein AAF712_002602 [Marasmius tenuissimus]|uniref:Uncharacterized protein n=1 Tax=Marasmius tenuissimus TaxID=585030 RepID=A0ABR3A9A9_9AGAR